MISEGPMKWIGAAALAMATAGAGWQGPRPAAACADASRRAAAIQFARLINSYEAIAFSNQRSYAQLGDLPVGFAPKDMTVQLSTDGESYMFSIKDTADACKGALFSDQQGLIYVGTPLQ
jgi:hypothetical protein